MPSISTQYTPFESLLFLQSIVRNGPDPSTLSLISHSLKDNCLVRSDEKYDAHRLAPEALKTLYDELCKAEEDAQPPPLNGNILPGDINPRKRKVSASPDPLGRSEDGGLRASQMVDRLYVRYREQTIQEIKTEEQQYQTLVAEIKTLEHEAQAVQKPAETPVQSAPSPHQLHSSVADRSLSPARDGPTSLISPAHAGIPPKNTRSPEQLAQYAERKLPDPTQGQMLPPRTPGSEGSFPRPPSAAEENQRQSIPAARVSPAPPSGPPGQAQQQPSNVSPRYGHIPPPLPLPSTLSPQPSNTLPPISSIVPQPTAPKTSLTRKKSSGSAPPRTSPLLPSPSPQYPPQQYGHPYPAWPQYHPPNSPYANAQFYHQQQYPRHLPPAQSPVYNQYQPYPQPSPNQFGPGPYPRPPLASQSPQYIQFPWPGQPASASTTPAVKHFQNHPRVRSSGTSTPWTPGGTRGRSPERPVRERDVSPLSDRAASPEDAGNDNKEAKQMATSEKSPPKESSRRRRGKALRGARGGRSRSSALASRSRSQSLSSATSDIRQELAASTMPSIQNIKHEASSTPAPFASDSEQRSSGRRRGRSDAPPAPPSETGRSINKRKRESGTEPSPSPSLPTPRPLGNRIRLRPEPVDPSHVAVTKNFARMAAPILNDVNGHKHAGTFAKPLTEREAPGYKDLIYRPQDLKSIRAAVARGSRAANAAIDEMEAKTEERGISESLAAAGATKTHTTTTTTTTPAGCVLVCKTEDLTPPKGIVNSAQLEMEFIRMFANAIMFNPLPSSERGLPPHLVMQRDGAGASSSSSSRKRKTEPEAGDDEDGDGDGDADGDGEKKGYAQEDEGGIIHDTREMFASVEKAVGQWRSVELGYPYMDDVPRSNAGLGLGSGLGLRGGSVSMSDVLAEESAQEEGEAALGGVMGTGVGVGSGNVRKRRRLVD